MYALAMLGKWHDVTGGRGVCVCYTCFGLRLSTFYLLCVSCVEVLFRSYVCSPSLILNRLVLSMYLLNVAASSGFPSRDSTVMCFRFFFACRASAHLSNA